MVEYGLCDSNNLSVKVLYMWKLLKVITEYTNISII